MEAILTHSNGDTYTYRFIRNISKDRYEVIRLSDDSVHILSQANDRLVLDDIESVIFSGVPKTTDSSISPDPEYIIRKILSTEQINGAVSSFAYEINGRYIWMFGESHRNPSTCSGKVSMSVNDLVDMFAKKSPACCDLFIEGVKFTFKIPKAHPLPMLDELKKLLDITISPLSAFIKDYFYCLTSKESLCLPSGNIRVHNIDIRSPLQGIHNIGKIFDIIRERYKADPDEIIRRIESFRPIYVHLLNGELPEAFEKMSILVSGTSPTLEKWYSPEGYDLFLKRSSFVRIHKQFIQLPDRSMFESAKKLLLDLYDSKITQRPRNIYDDIAYIHVMLMDAYSIGRILKTIYVYTDSRILFVHAGSDHIQNYNIILAKLQLKYHDGRVLYYATENQPGDSCVDISEQRRGLIVETLRTVFQKPSVCHLKHLEK